MIFLNKHEQEQHSIFLLMFWVISFYYVCEWYASYQYLYISQPVRHHFKTNERAKNLLKQVKVINCFPLCVYGFTNHIACILTWVLFDSFGLSFFYLVLFSFLESPDEAANAKKENLVFIVGSLRIWATCNSIELSFAFRRAKLQRLVLKKPSVHIYCFSRQEF